jgi:hypothetical protein
MVCNTFNHQNNPVDELFRQKSIDAEQPPGFSCPACARAKVQRISFNSKEREEDGPPLAPFAIVEYDIGAAFGQPLRAKSEAVQALRVFAKWFWRRAEGITVKLQLAQPLCLGIGRSDRDGAFTTARGAKRSFFDEEAGKVLLERYFCSKDSSRTATTKV